jgi:signal peptide peptidase SppA
MTKVSKDKNKAPDLNLSEFCKGQFWPIHPPAFEDMYRRLGQENRDGGLTQYAVDLQQKSVEKDYYSLLGDTAIIPISGPLMKRESFFSFFFGGSSYAFVQSAVKAALVDDEVASIVLRVDSPGGVVNGVEETAELIYNAKDQKPIVAYADGMMASAAYWIGSAATEIVAATTSMVGSIGVLMVHDDWSKYNEKVGLDVTYLTAGKYKALGNPAEPLSDLARETFQADLNYLYTLFVETVARNRDVEEGKVLSDMADGRIFIGQQSADAGLVDYIGNFELAYERAQALPDDSIYKFSTTTGGNTMSKEEDIKITMELLKESAPDLLAQIENDAFTAGSEAGLSDGVVAERARVIEILDADAAAEQTRAAIKDGTEANAAFKLFYEAEKSKRAQGLAQLETEATQSAGVEDPAEDPVDEKTPEQKRRAWRPAIGPLAA